MSGHEQPGSASTRCGLQKYRRGHARLVAPWDRCTPGCPQPSHIPSPRQDTRCSCLAPSWGPSGAQQPRN